MNIDKIEKMKVFPSFINYMKVNIKSNLDYIIIILLLVSLLSSWIVGIISILIFSIFEYFIDKKIFSAFAIRRLKK